MSILSKLLAVFLLMVSASAFSTNYYWAKSGYASASTPSGACANGVPSYQYIYDHYVFRQTVYADCYYLYSGSSVLAGYAQRFGDGCTAPLIYDSSVGSCVSPPPNCAGDVSAVASATRMHWIVAPITCDAIDANGNALCHGTNPQTGKPDSQNIACNGGFAGPAAGPIPAPVPSPPPQVNVDFPKCPAGSYEYVDTDGSTSCSVNGITVSSAATPCGSVNYGSVNGTMVCLPSNPAPATAATAAAAAAALAQTAKANPATPAAQAAAAGAAADAQKATDAANSLPGDTATQNSAANAVASAKQAAGYAGTSYTGPGGPGNGTAPALNLPTDYNRETTQQRIAGYLDPTGMPGASDVAAAMATQGTALDAAIKAHTDSLTGVVSSDGKDTSWGWLPSFPTGECTPFVMGSLPPVDWCPVVPTLKDIASWLWGLVTVLAILAMTHKAIRGS